MGGFLATLAYHGRSGDAGLDQINFSVPFGVSGCSIPIVVQESGTTLVSNTATIAVAPNRGTTCSDPTGLPLSSITPNGNGTINEGFVTLTTNTSITPAFLTQPASTTTTAGGVAIFEQYSAQQVTSGIAFKNPSIGGCVVNLTNLANISAPTFTGLNAGSSIPVTGPDSLTLSPFQGFTERILFTKPVGGAASGQLHLLPDRVVRKSAPFTTTITRAASACVDQFEHYSTGIGRTVTDFPWTGGGANSYVEIDRLLVYEFARGGG